jgi:hypothetical protein
LRPGRDGRRAIERSPVDRGALDEVRGDDAPAVAADGDVEVARRQRADGRAVLVDDLHVDGDQIDGRAERRRLSLREEAQRDAEGQEDHSQSNASRLRVHGRTRRHAAHDRF